MIATDPVINIPVGTKFDDAEALSDEQTVEHEPSQTAITVTTTEWSSIAAQAFCVDVPAKIVGGPTAGELVGDCARMFTASGAAGVDLGLFLLAMTYALLKPQSNGSADEAGLGSRGVN